MAKRKKSTTSVPELDILGQINVDAAGLDVGAERSVCDPDTHADRERR